jgi:TRAP-type uncharacterized transport system fused permease subunit
VAEAKFWPTGIEATKVASAGLLVPFFIGLCPAIILQSQPIVSAVMGFISIIVILAASQVVFCNHYLVPVSPLERGAFLLIALVQLGALIVGNHILFAIGLILFIFLTIGQVKRDRVVSAQS